MELMREQIGNWRAIMLHNWRIGDRSALPEINALCDVALRGLEAKPERDAAIVRAALEAAEQACNDEGVTMNQRQYLGATWCASAIRALQSPEGVAKILEGVKP